MGDKIHKYSLLTNTSINKKYKPEWISSAAGKDCKIPLHAVMDELENHVSVPFSSFQSASAVEACMRSLNALEHNKSTDHLGWGNREWNGTRCGRR